MITTNPSKEIETIEVIGDTVMIITNESTAKKLLKRNPRAHVVKGNESDDRFALTYNLSDCNLLLGIKKAWNNQLMK